MVREILNSIGPPKAENSILDDSQNLQDVHGKIASLSVKKGSFSSFSSVKNQGLRHQKKKSSMIEMVLEEPCENEPANEPQIPQKTAETPASIVKRISGQIDAIERDRKSFESKIQSGITGGSLA